MGDTPLERLTKRMEKRSAPAAGDAPVKAVEKRYHILIVDDEPLNLDVLERLLLKRFDVTRFENPAEALQAVKSGKVNPALVISDQRMPGMMGTDLLEALRELRPECMRMLLTGFTDKSDLIGAINKGGVYRYITKPWRPDDLLANVDQALERFQLAKDREELALQLQTANTKLAETNAQLESALVKLRTVTVSQVDNELRIIHEQLSRLAITDSLTGLFNHRHFLQLLNVELKRAQRHKHAITVIVADVDNFKPYVAEHGQQAGDEVLKRIAGVLRDDLREPDVVARYGGDEFSFILPSTSSVGGKTTADRLRAAVEAHTGLGGDKPPAEKLTLSFGVAGYEPAEHTDGGDLTAAKVLEFADKALQQSKTEGGNTATYLRLPKGV